MGFIDKLRAMLGGSSAPDFAGFDPDDTEAYCYQTWVIQAQFYADRGA